MTPEQFIFSNIVIQLFESIAKPCQDGQGGPKIDAISEILTEKNLPFVYEPGIGIIINKQDNPRMILTSHLDLIRSFKLGFAEEHIAEVFQENENIFLRGALDNTITNAFAILIIESLFLQDIKDVEVILTEGEEVGMVGMRNYLQTYRNKSVDAFFINLDVTNDGWGKDASVEYDRPSFYALKQTQQILECINPHFTSYRVCDDIDAVNAAQCSGFSYCLPTSGMIHSYSNFTLVNSFSSYFHGLLMILMKFELNPEMHVRFSSTLFQKAIMASSFEDIKIEKPVRQESNFFASSVFAANLLEMPVFQDIEDFTAFEDFIYDVIMSEKAFVPKDFEIFFSEKEDVSSYVVSLLNEFEDEGIAEKKGNKYYFIIE